MSADSELLAVAQRYGLSEREAHRALEWARTSVTVQRIRDAKQASDRIKERQESERAGRVAQEASAAAVRSKPRVWCVQCERNVTLAEGDQCRSQWCKAKDRAA